jgi:hypothetical protein
MKYLLYAFLIYLAYLFIFRFLIPVIIASRKIKKGFKEMQEKMNAHQQQQQPESTFSSGTKTNPKPSSEDYIEFEEIK